MTPMLELNLRGVEVKLHGVQQDAPPKMVSVDHELIVDTDEDDRPRTPAFECPKIRDDLEHRSGRVKARRHDQEEGHEPSSRALDHLREEPLLRSMDSGFAPIARRRRA
ncbi:MAG TPA: hypothetical protein VIU42_05915 [Xanthobacteraceae bacterium]